MFLLNEHVPPLFCLKPLTGRVGNSVLLLSKSLARRLLPQLGFKGRIQFYANGAEFFIHHHLSVGKPFDFADVLDEGVHDVRLAVVFTVALEAAEYGGFGEGCLRYVLAGVVAFEDDVRTWAVGYVKPVIKRAGRFTEDVVIGLFVLATDDGESV